MIAISKAHFLFLRMKNKLKINLKPSNIFPCFPALLITSSDFPLVIKTSESFFFIWRQSPQWARASSFTRFLDHTQRRTTVCRNPLDEWSARRRNLYVTTHNTDNRQTSTSPVGLEPTISEGGRPQTYAKTARSLGPALDSLGYYNQRY